MRHNQKTGDDMRLHTDDTAAGRDPDGDRRDPDTAPVDRDDLREVDMSTPEREREEGLDPTPADRDERSEFMDEPDRPMNRSPQQMEADPEPTPTEADTMQRHDHDSLDTPEHDLDRDTDLDRDRDTEPEPVMAEPVAPVAAPAGNNGAEEPLDLWRSEDVERYRTQWQEIQTRFVDDPRDAVQSADNLLTEAIKSLATAVNGHKTELEGTWGTGGETEDLRLALRRYRSFLNQLLEV